MFSDAKNGSRKKVIVSYISDRSNTVECTHHLPCVKQSCHKKGTPLSFVDDFNYVKVFSVLSVFLIVGGGEEKLSITKVS